MEAIDIFCPLGKNAKSYAEFLFKTANIFASKQFQLNWNCVVTTSNEMAYDGIGVPAGFIKSGSVENNNANAYHYAVNAMSTSRAAIIDADVVVLYQDWDKALYERIDNKCPIVGSSHTKGSKDFQDFPNLCITMFDTNILKSLKINLDSTVFSKIQNKKESRINKLPVGSKLERDTGWQLPYAYKNAGYRGYPMPEVTWTKGVLNGFMTKREKNILSKERAHKIMSEQHLDGKLFSCHFRHSHHRSWNENLAQCFKSIVCRYVFETTGKELV